MEEVLQSLGPDKRYADPSAPIHARLMAAGGALPLPPPQLAMVLFALTFDPETEVKDKANATLAALPDNVVSTVLQAEVHPGLLGLFAEQSADNLAHLELIALNPATSDATVCTLAAMPQSRMVDIIAQNQVRLLRCPELFEALSENPVMGQATIDRTLDFLGLPKRETDSLTETEDDPPVSDAPIAGIEISEEEFSDELVQELPEDAPKDEATSANICALIQNMTVIEKVKLARFGNGEARSLLVRDRNRMVASAAIRSPKITDNEVVQFAKSRALSDDVVRIISNTREWVKNYSVKLALVANPKTPTANAIKFLNTLTDRDLKTIMRSRDIPGQIVQTARRILIRKGKA